MNARWLFDLWREHRELRETLLDNLPTCRLIGISESARILKTCPGCDLDGDTMNDGCISRYFNLQLGIIEKEGVAIM